MSNALEMFRVSLQNVAKLCSVDNLEIGDGLKLCVHIDHRLVIIAK